jgi:hypothetical protein
VITAADVNQLLLKIKHFNFFRLTLKNLGGERGAVGSTFHPEEYKPAYFLAGLYYIKFILIR